MQTARGRRHCAITRALWHLRPPATRVFVQQVLYAYNKGNNKAPYYPIRGESTSDQWASIVERFSYHSVILTSPNRCLFNVEVKEAWSGRGRHNCIKRPIHSMGVWIRLSASTCIVNCTYEFSEVPHMTTFRRYGTNSTGSSTYCWNSSSQWQDSWVEFQMCPLKLHTKYLYCEKWAF